MSELAKRVSVAAIGIPAVLALIVLGGWYLAVPLAVLAGVGADELYRIAEAGGVRPFRSVGVIAATAAVLLAAWRPEWVAFAPWALAVLVLVMAVACVAALRSREPQTGAPLAAVSTTAFGVVYAGLALALVPLLIALPEIRGWAAADARWAGLAVVALPLAATWAGDSAAFFAGSAWGRRRLAPSISPKKSWEGFWAGVAAASVAGAVWSIAVGTVLPGLVVPPWLGAAIGALLGVGAVVGDLVESLLKREGGVKDSGNVFPGHGGVLDRVDALIFTFPLAYAVLHLFGAGS